MAAGRPTRAGRLARSFLFALAALAVAPAGAQEGQPRLSPADLGTAMSAYVDGVVEWRQFYLGCATDPEGWDAASALLTASLEAAGIGASQVSVWNATLAASAQGAASYDCGSEISKFRLTIDRPATWSAYHSQMLKPIGLKIVPADDPRAAAVRAVFDEYVPMQKKVLHCSALVLPSLFPIVYADWNEQVMRAGVEMLGAPLPAGLGPSLVNAARSQALMQPVADRQAELAACSTATDWQDWWASFRPFAFVGDVKKALGAQ